MNPLLLAVAFLLFSLQATHPSPLTVLPKAVEDELRMAFVYGDESRSKMILDRLSFVPVGAIPYVHSVTQVQQLIKFSQRHPIPAAAFNWQEPTVKRTALHTCCYLEEFEAAMMLVTHFKADVNVLDMHGMTPLMLTLMAVLVEKSPEYTELRNLLLSLSDLTLCTVGGKNIFELTKLDQADLRVALDGAIKRNDTDSVLSILDYSSNIPFDFIPAVNSLHMLIALNEFDGDEVKEYVNEVNPATGLTLLHMAVHTMDLLFVTYLIQDCGAHGAVSDSEEGESPLTLAALILGHTDDQSEIKNMNKIMSLILGSLTADEFREIYENEDLKLHLKMCQGKLGKQLNHQLDVAIDPAGSRLKTMRKELDKHRKTKHSLARFGMNVDFTAAMAVDDENLRQTIIKVLDAGKHMELHFLLAFFEGPLDGVALHIKTMQQLHVFEFRLGTMKFRRLITIDQDWGNLLHHAVFENNFILARGLLLKHHIDPNAQDKFGRTSLMVALDAAGNNQSADYNSLLELLIPCSEATALDKCNRDAGDLLEIRKIYKRISVENIGWILDQRYRHPLKAEEMTRLLQLSNS